MPALNRYRICGLRLASVIAFPELRALSESEGAAGPDIELVVAQGVSGLDAGELVMATEMPDGTPWLICTRAGAGYRFRFPQLAEFCADAAGRSVTCAVQQGTPPETVRHLFLDQVMPLLVNLRGGESLHASAVQVGGGVCAFIGRSGQGKSTLAAAFHMSGNTAWCDDCLLVHAHDRLVRVGRAYAGLRLWEDSRDALFGERPGDMKVSHYSTKLRIATHEAEETGAVVLPLRAVYALQLDDEGGALKAPLIEPLSLRDGLMALIEYAYRLDLSDRRMIVRQLEFFEQVARTVPVRRLCLPNDLGALPAARSLVLHDLSNG